MQPGYAQRQVPSGFWMPYFVRFGLWLLLVWLWLPGVGDPVVDEPDVYWELSASKGDPALRDEEGCELL